MDIQITTTPALIGIHRRPGKLEIQQPKADIQIHTEHPKIEIHSQPIKVQIDQYPCFAEAGLKNFLDSTKEYAEIGKRRVLEGIRRIVIQGNELADIHVNSEPLPSQAEQNAFHWNDAEFYFDVIPKSRPIIDFIGGNVDIQVHKGEANVDVQVNAPILGFTKGKVEIYLRQKNRVQIEYIGHRVNTKI